MIPFPDLESSCLELKDELDAACHRVLEPSCYLPGKKVAAFAGKFAEFCGVEH